ncbi:MAG: hypothetical protein KDD04_03715 [Sinomicrobium sp.]|nr:hypothetical protein [Sinomicrobium sp.]
MITKALIRPFFKLEKLKIALHKTKERNDKNPEIFRATFNPDSFTHSFSNNFAKQQVIEGNNEINYTGTAHSNLRFKLIVDDTDITGASSPQSLTNHIENFIKKVIYVDGQIHEPRYIKVSWGDYFLDCRVERLDVKYTLFDRGGNALRAELDIAFIEDTDDRKRQYELKLSSPDLTHVKVVKKGDTLSMMSREVYGSSDYYIQVARHNKLNNFRKLEPGTELYFPPIAK